ncbi:MAG: peptide transporter permease [Alphaproteobacteria bacterium]|nr:peptide transporter permease [Alphaproteobacteria bacterium]
MRLDPEIIGLVLLAALLHASWNAVVKSDRDRLLSMGVVMAAGGVFGAIVACLVPLPDLKAWPYMIASVIIHNFYYYFLLRAYAHGDLGHVYPIARGLGPLLVAMLSSSLLGETLRFSEAVGVVLISLGIVGLSFAGGWRQAFRQGWGTTFAVLTGLTIAGYTIVDGLGARASGSALGYIAWLNILEGPWVLLIGFWRRGTGPALHHILTYGWRSAIGGVIAAIGYGIAIWALSLGAMAHVAALRETSVLFAALMGTFLLGETMGWRRILAATTIVSGLLLMNLPL